MICAFSHGRTHTLIRAKRSVIILGTSPPEETLRRRAYQWGKSSNKQLGLFVDIKFQTKVLSSRPFTSCPRREEVTLPAYFH